jgi:NO-binding membrane sensor protein with MHYT domain
MLVTGTHDPYLVALSILVASFASYTALDLAAHAGAARGLARRLWLVAAAITMGGGIWSMHFVAMLAFIVPVPLAYDLGVTALSLLVAIFVTSASFYVISRPTVSPLRVALSGIFMGFGIVAMHYTGMAAMRGHAELSYESPFVALSLVIAVGASTAALWLAFRTTDLGQRLVAAVVMGLAISGMHYTAMRAAIFTVHGPLNEASKYAGLDQTTLALVVAGTTFVLLAFALGASLFEQQCAEEALRQARADLAHVNRVTTMGALTASLAHEVNQPITAVVTNAYACLHWLEGETPNLAEARASAMSIVEDGTRAADIIGRTRLLFQKGAPRREPVDLNEIIREMVVLLRSETARHSISVRTDLAPHLPRVMGDRVQLQQVMMNLMINSVDAMRDVEGVRELFIRTQGAGDEQLTVCVSDTGVGLPPQQADQIFYAFFTTKPQGTGMGLSISHSIVESHHGRLWAVDNSPRGARFHVTLPAAVDAYD